MDGVTQAMGQCLLNKEVKDDAETSGNNNKNFNKNSKVDIHKKGKKKTIN